MTFSVEGKTAIVTGAAHGVGLAIGHHLLDAGAKVMFADMDEEKLEEEVETDPERCARFAGDLRERLTLANLMSATIDAFDRVDILVNASREVVASDPLSPTDDAMEHLLQQNLLTSLRLSQLTAKRMIAQAEDMTEDDLRPVGSIINLSSIAARRTHPQLLAFSVSAAALDQLTRSLAVALAPNRIRGECRGLWLGHVLKPETHLARKNGVPWQYRRPHAASADRQPLGGRRDSTVSRFRRLWLYDRPDPDGRWWAHAS